MPIIVAVNNNSFGDLYRVLNEQLVEQPCVCFGGGITDNTKQPCVKLQGLSRFTCSESAGPLESPEGAQLVIHGEDRLMFMIVRTDWTWPICHRQITTDNNRQQP